MTRPAPDPPAADAERGRPTRRWLKRSLLVAAILVVGVGWTLGGIVLLLSEMLSETPKPDLLYNDSVQWIFMLFPVAATLVAVAAAVAPSRWRRALWFAAGVLFTVWFLGAIAATGSSA